MDSPVAKTGSIASRLLIVFHETWKYLLVSVAALAVDYALLAALTRLAGVEWQIAAAASFTAGLFVNYILSVTFVFKERRVKSRGLEFAGFFVIGALGLGINGARHEVLRRGPSLRSAAGQGAGHGHWVRFQFRCATGRAFHGAALGLNSRDGRPRRPRKGQISRSEGLWGISSRPVAGNSPALGRR